MNMYGKVAESKPGYLVAETGNESKIAINVAPGNAKVARGTVLYRQDSGIYAPATAADVTTTKYLVVLDEEVDTALSDTVAQAAAAYRTGTFFTGKVVLKNGAELTNENIVALRNQGILLAPLDDWTEDDKVINNSVAGE